jgi:hypothetical protein
MGKVIELFPKKTAGDDRSRVITEAVNAILDSGATLGPCGETSRPPNDPELLGPPR